MSKVSKGRQPTRSELYAQFVMFVMTSYGKLILDKKGRLIGGAELSDPEQTFNGKQVSDPVYWPYSRLPS